MTDTVSRIPRAALEQIITAALDGMDLEHDTAWVRPPECPCHGRSLSCLSPGSTRCGCDDRRLVQEQRELVCGNGRQPACERTPTVPGAFRCLGHTAEVPTPPEHVVTAGHLLSALPVPDNDGTVGAQEAALAVISVCEERLSYPYTLRAIRLRDRLVAASEEYEQQAGLTDSSDSREDAGSWMPRCQWCGQPCGDKRARYCRPSHRQQAYKQRKRNR